LGQARAGALRERLVQALRAWQHHWFTHAATLDLAIEHGNDPPWAGTLGIMFVAEQQPLLHLGASAEFVARLLGLQAMSAPAAPGGSDAQLARSLQLEMLQHLGESLLALAAVQATRLPAADDDAVEPPVDTRRWWYANFMQPHSFERLVLLIHPTVVTGLTPVPQAAPTAPCTSRRIAVGCEAVGVEALLGHVQLTLRDFTTLSTGDVLVLEHDQSAYLTAHDGEHIATLQPGRRDGQRAVRIDAVLQRPDAPHPLPSSRGL
jgi:hypothetical protein